MTRCYSFVEAASSGLSLALSAGVDSAAGAGGASVAAGFSGSELAGLSFASSLSVDGAGVEGVGSGEAEPSGFAASPSAAGASG